MTNTQAIDLSYELSAATPFFPGTNPIDIEILERTEDPANKGRRSLNVSRFSITVHTGTHMDAPFHFFGSGITIDQIPLDRCVGQALLIDVSAVPEGAEIEPADLMELRDKLLSIPKVILKTGWAERWGTPGYFTDHPRISGKAAEFLVECGVHLVGTDMPSVDRPPFPAHLALLGQGVVIVENLTNLDSITSDEFELTVLPLKLSGRDGSPVRAIARFQREFRR
jgi:kynurenine formamidase